MIKFSVDQGTYIIQRQIPCLHHSLNLPYTALLHACAADASMVPLRLQKVQHQLKCITCMYMADQCRLDWTVAIFIHYCCVFIASVLESHLNS